MEIGFEESMVVGASDAHESQALLPHRQAQNTHLDALLRQGSETQKHDNAFTDHDESDIWMKFEVRRRSANFYLDEYLQARAVVDNLCVSDNQSQSIALPGQESPASRSYWRMKAARDNLLQDLRTLCCLLETISPSTAALFAKSCIFPLFLALSLSATETPLMASHLGSGLRIARVAILIAFVPSMVYSACRGGRWFVVHLCQKAVDFALDKTVDKTLEGKDRKNLRGIRFKMLSLMNH